jgi:DNA-binding transcriptional ArsR family regulator
MQERELEKVLKAFANRRRLAIVKYLKVKHEATVSSIAAAIKLSFRSTSKHLGVLSVADVVDREQRSLTVYYRLADRPSPFVRTLTHLV